jgi:hypothetical protein
MSAPGVLKVTGQEEPLEVRLDYGPGCSKQDAVLLKRALAEPRLRTDGSSDPSLIAQLRARGYDLSTLSFTIRKTEVASGAATERITRTPCAAQPAEVL